MIVRWMLAAIGIAAALSVAGLCMSHLCTRVGIARRWLYLALMIVSVIVPVGVGLRTAQEGPAMRGGAAGGVLVESVAPRPADPADVDALMLRAWAITSLALALFLAATQRRMRGQVRAWRRRELLGQMVTLSPDFGPAAIGLWRATIVLPEWVLDLPLDEQRLVLRHEQEHVAAGDQLLLFAGVALIVLVPWNPALWWQLRRLRIALELDCDARVAPRAVDRPRYGELLLQTRIRQRSHHGALAFAPTASMLTERLHALLESTRLSHRQVARWGASAVACVGVATSIPVPGLATLFRPTAPTAEPRQLKQLPAASGELTEVSPPVRDRRAARPRLAARIDPPTAIESAGAVGTAPAVAPSSTRMIPTGVNMPADGFGSGGAGGGGGGRSGGRGGGFASFSAAPPAGMVTQVNRAPLDTVRATGQGGRIGRVPPDSTSR